MTMYESGWGVLEEKMPQLACKRADFVLTFFFIIFYICQPRHSHRRFQKLIKLMIENFAEFNLDKSKRIYHDCCFLLFFLSYNKHNGIF